MVGLKIGVLAKLKSELAPVKLANDFAPFHCKIQEYSDLVYYCEVHLLIKGKNTSVYIDFWK